MCVYGKSCAILHLELWFRNLRALGLESYAMHYRKDWSLDNEYTFLPVYLSGDVIHILQ